MDTVGQIKDRLDIKEVIQDYIKLEKSGANFRARCPFHNEKTPSFFVSPTRQLWRCFGCGEGGDMFSFVEKIEGVDFKDSLRTLANKAGVEVKAQNPKERGQKNKSKEICALVAKYFHHQLESKNGKFVTEYLQSRGINQESINNFILGYAPVKGESLVDFLKEKGYEYADMDRAGIVYQREVNKKRELRFRGRIIFPIFNLAEDVVGFGGRKLTDDLAQKMSRRVNPDLAKYINSPQTNIYDKGNILYGLDKAKIAIRQQDACIVAEGYTDVILAHQAGFKNVVSASGTALTENQLKLIKRFTENLITAFDMDLAGDTATRRGINLAQEMGFNVHVIVLPDSKDPADIIQDNPKEWENAVKNAKNILDFYVDSAFTKHDTSTPAGKKKVSSELAPILKALPNRVEQADWVQVLAGRLGVKPEDVWEDVKRAGDNQNQTNTDNQDTQNILRLSRKQMLARQILLHGLKNPKLHTDIKKFLQQHNDTILIEFRILSDIVKDSDYKPNKKEEKDLIDNLLFEAEVKGGEWTQDTLQDILREYGSLVLKEEMQDLYQKQVAAEKAGEMDRVEELSKEHQEKSQQLDKIQQ